MTIVEICNIALGYLGEDSITALSDGTTRADLCNQIYAAVRDAVLEDRDWQFASLWAAQATIASTSKNPRLAYQASKPTGTLSVREVVDAEGDAIDWLLEGELILVDDYVADAVAAGTDGVYVHVTQSVADTTKWPNAFILAFAHRLAAELAVPLSENVRKQETEWALYRQALEIATSNDSMQGRPIQGPYVSTLANARSS